MVSSPASFFFLLYGFARSSFLALNTHTFIGLDRLLIVIRSLLIVCDHVQSKERLIAINRPIAISLHYWAAGTTAF